MGVGGQAEEEERTKVNWTEGRRGSRWVWKCMHLPQYTDRKRATGLKDEITRHTSRVGKLYYSVVHVLTENITTPDSVCSLQM